MSFNLTSFLGSDNREIILRGVDKQAFIDSYRGIFDAETIGNMESADYIQGIKTDSRTGVDWYARNDELQPKKRWAGT